MTHLYPPPTGVPALAPRRPRVPTAALIAVVVVVVLVVGAVSGIGVATLLGFGQTAESRLPACTPGEGS